MKRVRRLSVLVTVSTGVIMLAVLLGASRGTEGTPVRQEASAPYGQTSTPLPDGRWVFIGGIHGRAPQASAVLWDPVRNTRTPTWHAPRFARAGHTATVLPDGTVLVLGARDAGPHAAGLPLRHAAHGRSCAHRRRADHDGRGACHGGSVGSAYPCRRGRARRDVACAGRTRRDPPPRRQCVAQRRTWGRRTPRP